MNSISVVELLELSIFKCNYCKKRCRYPVMTANKLNYCSSCLDEIYSTTMEKNIEINGILEKFLLPCRFNDNGCDLADRVVDITRHEKVCEFRDRICPLYKLNKCTANSIFNVPDHFNSQHPQYVVQPENDTVKLLLELKNYINLDLIRLMIFYNEYFLVHIKFDVTNNNLLYALYLCGDPEDIKNYDCIIQAQNNDFQIKNKKIDIMHESEFTIPINSQKAVCYNLSKMQICSDKFETDVKICAKNGLTKVHNTALLASLKCPTCKTYMRNEIRQCMSGHSICPECIVELQQCTICNAPFSGTRNYALESLSALLKYPCTHKGCNKYFSAKNITKHEHDCSLKENVCPFQETLHCKWSGLHKDIKQHLKQNHSTNISECNSFLHRIFLNNSTYEVHCLIAYSNVFRFHFEKCETICSVRCKYYGPRTLAKRFSFEIGIPSSQQKDNKLTIKSSWNKCNEDELWIEVHEHNIQHYMTPQNEILIEYKIMKYYEQ